MSAGSREPWDAPAQPFTRIPFDEIPGAEIPPECVGGAFVLARRFLRLRSRYGAGAVLLISSIVHV